MAVVVVIVRVTVVQIAMRMDQHKAIEHEIGEEPRRHEDSDRAVNANAQRSRQKVEQRDRDDRTGRKIRG